MDGVLWVKGVRPAAQGRCRMSLRAVAAMSSEQRASRRLHDEQVHDRVESLIAAGTDRTKAFTRGAGLMEWKREEAVAAYWRHRRRLGW